MEKQLSGQENFSFDNINLGFTMLDYWRFHYSNIFDLQDTIAEFIVAKALDIHESQNDQYWTLWDLTYRDKHIEIKETSYYHSFNTNGKISKQRVFDIHKSNGGYDEKSGNNELIRQNDLYIFCLNTGNTEEESYPLNLNNWEFYVVPTKVINEQCGDNKTISLGRIRSFGFNPIYYAHLKKEIDTVIDNL